MTYPRFKISMTIPEVFRSVFDAFGTGDNLAPTEFARELKSFGSHDHIVMTGSGRAGFRLLLESLDIPSGAEIIFPAYTFHIMPEVAAACGLRPVFADVDPETWNIDPEKIVPLINENTRVIMPTHLFGVPADMEKIGAIAREHGLLLFEDCAHALGALDGDEPVGNKGDAALFTFAMSKNMPCWGGGAIVVRDEELAQRMLGRIDDRGVSSPLSILRRQISNIPGIILTQRFIFPWTLYPAIRLADSLGSDYFDRPFIEEVKSSEGGNQLLKDSNQVSVIGDQDASGAGKNRITGISPFQASVGLRQLKRFPGWLDKQVRNARLLRGLLKDCPGLQLQQEPEGTRSSFLYVRARVDDPPAVRRKLLRAGIDTKPDDMRDCAALNIFSPQIICPAAEKLGGHCIELPCSHFYSEPQINQIADRIIDAL